MTQVSTILNATSRVHIICHSENIDQLASVLSLEGFDVEISRQIGSVAIEKFSPIVKCLLNHYSVWKTVRDTHSSAVIVEADFVPVVGFGKLSCPFPPENWKNSFGYLYGCGIEIYDMVDSKLARGHSGAMVAYYVSSDAASHLCEFAEEFFRTNDPTLYSPWDTQIRIFIQNRGVNSFVPFRNFGEHGGIPNYEHRNAGLGGTHRADVLAGPLHFLPAYAKNSNAKYIFERFRARCWGLGRLFLGRLLKIHDIKRQSSPYPILRFAINRQAALLKNFKM